MNQMEIFKNPEFGSIRVIEEDGKFLFSGLDVAMRLDTAIPALQFPGIAGTSRNATYPIHKTQGKPFR